MDLVGAFDHLKYEFQMLLITAQLIEKRGLSNEHGNAILESWVLHARNLIDFFYIPKKQDDIVMVDFLLGEEWKKNFPEISEDLEIAKNRANKEMAHLTHSRIGMTEKEKLWPVGKITDQLIDRMVIFAGIVEDQDIASSLKVLLPKKSSPRFLVSTHMHTSGFSGGILTFKSSSRGKS